MTDEQIKQNAEAYASYFYSRNSTVWQDRYNAYIAGARSRDKEIYVIKMESEIRDGLLRDKHKLQDELDKLRNPWRDAKKDPPKKEIGNKIFYTFFDTAYDGVHEQRYYHYAEFKKYGSGKEEWIDEDGNRVLVEIADYWMPIPELKKG